jgi:hypothetical protein
MRNRPVRRRFVPRAIFGTALAAVVPSITATACRRPLGVAHRGFEQRGVAAQFASHEEPVDAGSSTTEARDVIDAGATAEDSASSALVTQPDRDLVQPLPVAYQGFANDRAVPHPADESPDAGPRPRARRR